jgi:hypothetical protein
VTSKDGVIAAPALAGRVVAYALDLLVGEVLGYAG